MNQPLTNTAPLAERIESRVSTDTAGDMTMSMAVGGLAFQNMLEVMEFSKLMAISDVAVPKHIRNNPGACLAITMQAFAWGFDPFSVANKSYSVNDRMAYESQLIQAVILKRAPIKGRFTPIYTGEAAERQCRISVTTLDGEVLEYQSPKVKDIKVKNSPLWQGDPDQQLFYYSARALCRRHFPDVILGVYSRDELDGAEQMKDVTAAKPSGLAARLAGGNNGFNADAVSEALDQTAARGSTAAQAEVSAIVENGEVVKSKGDPEIVRAGAQAFSDGEERLVPLDFGPAEGKAWLEGYDAAKVAAEAEQQADA